VNERKPQELFFAGRSVLHRIDADIRKRTKTFAEDVLLRRLTEGSKIKILFLDPRTSILDRLAKEEGQRARDMLADIATSLGICRRLHALLEEQYDKLQPGAQLGIRVYDRVPYFAYHKQDDIVLVGFYFRSTIGSTSAAYEPVDDVTKRVFGDHFVQIYGDAVESALLEFDGARGRAVFDVDLFDALSRSIRSQLGDEKTDELLKGPVESKVRLAATGRAE
jgi:hypothetical protein